MNAKSIPAYSITLNFFAPSKIIKNLKKLTIPESIIFDWRDSNLTHCTLKAIYYGYKLQHKKEFESWAVESRHILSKQKPFNVLVKGIRRFPTVLVANVYSKELLKLHQKLFKVLPSSQPQFENKNYCPHISIAIIKGKTKAMSPQRKIFGKFKVDEIQLMLWNMKNSKKSKLLYAFKLKKTSKNF